MTVDELRARLSNYPGLLRVVVDPFNCNEYHDVSLDQRTDPDTKVEVLCMEDAYIASVEDGLPDVDPREEGLGDLLDDVGRVLARQDGVLISDAKRLLAPLLDAHRLLRAELATTPTLYDRQVQGGLDLRAELCEMEHLKDDRERSLAYVMDAVKRLEKELAAERALRP